MRLLLDTHVAIWSLVDPTKINRRGRDMIGDRSNEIFVSVVSIWELAIKHAFGRADGPPFSADVAIEEFSQSGFSTLAITAAHAAAIERLDYAHRDPFDRLLLAQASTERMKLLTQDANLTKHGCAVISTKP